ncbi:MAG: sigma-54-dependent Fis family transcriptional regulator [Rhodocyclaceae bacterium]|nr:sigma-54-dependent Fis family transcriptional regulator [Rhodocyclaceae bacterium]
MSLAHPSGRRPVLWIIDDDALIADTLSYALGDEFEITTLADRPACVRQLRSPCPRPELVLLDLGLPPSPHQPDEGYALIADLLAHAPDTRIVVLSGQDQNIAARHARALGATEFVAKPADPQSLRSLLQSLLATPDTGGAGARAAIDAVLIGNSEAMRRLRSHLSLYTDTTLPVLLQGESGTGKEIVAQQYLHRASVRRDKPFLALNCAAISPHLVEPTLFGSVKGAYTGAERAQTGYFEDAGDGTLFLDEIGELPLEAQAKLLRVLENGEYQRVGETRPRHARARIVAATNRDLRAEVRAGRFRLDLYHRLSVFTIELPPLRDMGDDRLLLLDHFSQRLGDEMGREPFHLTPAARRLWRDYAFPGNVRELRNIVLRLLTKSAGRTLDVSQLAEEFDADPVSSAEGGPSSPTVPSQEALRHLQSAHQVYLDDILRTWERAYVEAALKLAQGNVSQAARLLGMQRTTLYHRLATLGRDADTR